MLLCCVCEGEIQEEPPGCFYCYRCDQRGFVVELAFPEPDAEGRNWGIVVTPAEHPPVSSSIPEVWA